MKLCRTCGGAGEVDASMLSEPPDSRRIECPVCDDGLVDDTFRHDKRRARRQILDRAKTRKYDR